MKNDKIEYLASDLVRIAKRENNTKRNFLIVNPLQGKHVPVEPSRALNLFSRLAETFSEEYHGERILVIGFAETATAIGAQVAITMDAHYIQTTREMIHDVKYLFFQEEHSHATQQKLIKDDMDAIAGSIDRILFVEDEITTGNTILNIVNVLEKEYPGKFKYAVASVLNGMDLEHLKLYEKKKIHLHYLQKTDYHGFVKQADKVREDGDYYDCLEKAVSDFTTINISGCMDPRRLLSATKYKKSCEELWDGIKKEIGNICGKRILIIGTEEFMFPALYVGNKMEEQGNDVMCHATTRSPIAVSLGKEYPLHTRYELKSLYDANRRTFLYNIGKYDKVFIITDAPEIEESRKTLLNALMMQNQDITIVRWC